mgnify:CR=1 FL=1
MKSKIVNLIKKAVKSAVYATIIIAALTVMNNSFKPMFQESPGNVLIAIAWVGLWAIFMVITFVAAYIMASYVNHDISKLEKKFDKKLERQEKELKQKIKKAAVNSRVPEKKVERPDSIFDAEKGRMVRINKDAAKNVVKFEKKQTDFTNIL